jgi:hypothetical protein
MSQAEIGPGPDPSLAPAATGDYPIFDTKIGTMLPAPTPHSYRGRRLVVMLTMHRSGSSVTTALFQQLGMSLGPFELLEPTPWNEHGHFEARPFHILNRELQAQVFGFSDDVPGTREKLVDYCRCDGCWDPDTVIGPEAYQRGSAMLRELVESGTISGFKDPRTLLIWPFWQKVFAEFPGLEIIPVFLTRSPHEIAMSIFNRARGAVAYEDALDVTAVHFRRMLEIQQGWQGPQAVVRFDPAAYCNDAAKAAEVCGLSWNEAAFAGVYDPQCKHHAAAVVSHPAQTLFERLSGAPPATWDLDTLRRLKADAATRTATMRAWFATQLQTVREAVATGQNFQNPPAHEELLAQHRRQIEYLQQQNSSCIELLKACRGENDHQRQLFAEFRQQIEYSTQALREAHQEIGQLRQACDELQREVAEKQQQLSQMQAPRTRRFREMVFARMRVG